jgi:hypothetical protein
MRHVQQRAGGVSLHAHVPGLGQTCERLQGAGACNLGLVVLVRRQVGNAPNGIALHLDIGRVHLLDQGRETTQCDNGDLVLGCGTLAMVGAGYRKL